jgi:hypothetical protein
MKRLNKKMMIRSSTAEFLIFTSQTGEDGIEVRVYDENVWLTQKRIARLFDVAVPAISKHLKNIFGEAELSEEAVVSILETTDTDGKNYQTKYYSLEAIIAIGYRVNSKKATEFRQWATQVLNALSVCHAMLEGLVAKNGITDVLAREMRRVLAELRVEVMGEFGVRGELEYWWCKDILGWYKEIQI